MSDRSVPQTPREQDRRLAAAVAGRDRAASEVFARRLLPLVRRTSMSLTKGASEGHDAAQIAMLELLRSARTFRGDASLESWARKITTRVVLRHLKRTRAKTAAAPLEEVDLRAATLETKMLEELPRPLSAYLQALPENQRNALVLRHTLGHTIPEIAEITGAPIPTVKSRIQKAHQELRRLIRRELNLGAQRNERTP